MLRSRHRTKPSRRQRDEDEFSSFVARPRAVAVAVRDDSARMVVPAPKENALQHEVYMAIVRRMARRSITKWGV